MFFILAVLEDLVFRSKLEQAAAAVQADLSIVSDSETALQRVAQAPPALILIDLSVSRGDSIALVAALRRAVPSTTIIGYCSHIQAELQAQALAAGCSVMLPRSVFVQRLPELLQAASAK